MNRTVVSGIAAFALLIGAGLAMSETTVEAGHCGGGLFSKLHAKKCSGDGLLSGLKDRNRGCGGGGLLAGHRDRGSLFNKGCGGGLLAKLKAKHASRCSAPEPTCCEPAPTPCCGAPEPTPCCGTPEPTPCCGTPEPTPCCGTPEPAPCCGTPAPTPCCGTPAPTPCCGTPAPTPCCGTPAPTPCCGTPAPVVSAGCSGCGSVGGEVANSVDSGYNLAPGETLVPGSVQQIGSESAPSSSDEAPAAVEEAAPPAPTPDTNA